MKKNPDEYEIWEKALMAAGGEKCDWTDKSYIVPIFWKRLDKFLFVRQKTESKLPKMLLQ